MVRDLKCLNSSSTDPLISNNKFSSNIDPAKIPKEPDLQEVNLPDSDQVHR